MGFCWGVRMVPICLSSVTASRLPSVDASQSSLLRIGLSVGLNAQYSIIEHMGYDVCN